ncbi:hypothetical protein HBI56_034570 [Parastagonospora nodorum]|uniref:Uncharacterized protein n=1 Tax=Phaeosphaeria nodorum (strain SN15 / ATCC MYA-4574 / FGSC 10173) TaxID=321614 RepID=A0A7U2HZ01_PHANO|nr:hypothetical protein HBH56_022370 [Parastagonospora nodorum]QRC95579.1 hypothetical protein JI435_302480 [Parastagonospora nodorum SN15]KAH3937033.1 hypothetical protein HBH54_012110 [Parastagonospora nodorum]KAH3967459.1 hypothetical protein HBH51_135560 [Parastagonospora nodorum]KAH4006758.1 hypothetical protein HBI10_012050 [Parastagonospora nodorum]
MQGDMSLYMRLLRRTTEGLRTASGLRWHYTRILVERRGTWLGVCICALSVLRRLQGEMLRVWRRGAVWVVADRERQFIRCCASIDGLDFQPYKVLSMNTQHIVNYDEAQPWRNKVAACVIA